MSTPLENDPQKSPFLHAASPVRKRASSTSSSPSTSPSSSPSPSPSRPLFLRGLLAGLLVVVLALGVWFFLKPAAPVPEKDDAPVVKRSRSVVAPAVTNALPKPRPVATNAAPPVVRPEPKEDTWLGTKVDHRTFHTNGTTLVEWIYTVDGKRHVYFHDISKPVFDNASDQLLALATEVAPGGMAPPLPLNGAAFEKAFADSLKKEIVIDADDSDEVKAVKERVIQARKDMLTAISEGMSPDEVFAEHRKMLEENAATRMEAVKDLREYLDKGDVEGAQAYCDKVNGVLESMGIMKIELPRSREEIAAERAERAAKRRAAAQAKQQENEQ